MRNPTWGAVRPRILDEMESIKTALTTAPADRIAALQARYAALDTVKGWFEREATADEPIFTEAV